MGPLRLRHLHLPSIHPHYIPYSLASRVQEHLRRQHLDFKDHASTTTEPSPQPPPPPTLISFTPSPIYTLGRRQTSPLTPTELTRLTSPLEIPPPSTTHNPSSSTTPPKTKTNTNVFHPKVLHSPRGGLTTYHGPGQVVLWPVLDIKSPQHKHFTVKCYARLLEATTIATLKARFGIDAATTGDPGVWVRSNKSLAPPKSPSQTQPSGSSSSSSGAADGEGKGEGEREGEPLAKIAALGVHLRRHITSLGTALNLVMPPVGVTDEAVNPWARIVACGLAGRAVTSVAGEVMEGQNGAAAAVGRLLGRDGEEVVARAWAEQLAAGLGLEKGGDGVEPVGVREVVGLMERLVGEGVGDGVNDEMVVREERRYVERMREIHGR